MAYSLKPCEVKRVDNEKNQTFDWIKTKKIKDKPVNWYGSTV